MMVMLLVYALSQAPQQAPKPPPSSAPVQLDYTVGAQDVLNVVVFGEPELSRSDVTVDNDGTIDCALIGRVKAAGRTTRAIEQDVRDLFIARKILVSPSVSVEVTKFRSQAVWVQGQVHSPGQFQLTGNASVMSVLAAAGSTTENAGSYIIISHRAPGLGAGPASLDDKSSNQIRVKRKDLEEGRAQDIKLHDQDTIFVPKAETFFVLGLVRSPGPYVYDDGLTVEKALSLAGGATDRAATGRITITRDGAEIKAKLSDLVKPNDTIHVKQRWF